MNKVDPSELLIINGKTYCLNCNVETNGTKYCCKGCGKEYRWKTRYSLPELKKNGRRVAQKKESHTCVFTDGKCIRCENEKRREMYKQNKRFYLNVGFAHRASFATGD